ncbi:MAG TPA: GDP-mannose 4,6-dehydratase [Tepidisphaeraceae bacterium]|nr:GDP-mannose 4,6-dehydratase [Tepidisphaeraceae bacterium]
MSKPTVLLTGAAGFIGSHTSEALIARGCRVVGVDNFCDFYSPAWKRANVKAIGSGIEIEELDITDAPRISKLVATVKPDIIVHLAAMAGVRPSIEQPGLYSRVNLDGTTYLLQAAVENKVQKFIFASSSSVYGNNSRVPFSEEDPVEEPISPYAATKRAGELICYTFSHLYKLPISCLRFFTVFGPRQRPDLAIHKFTRLIMAGKPIPFFGDGSMSRDHTFISDIVSGIMSSIDRCKGYRVYNLGGSHPVTLSMLVTEIEKAVGKKAIIDQRPTQPGDVERTYADLKRSGAELGYGPKVSLAEGLAQFVNWLKVHGPAYKLPGE